MSPAAFANAVPGPVAPAVDACSSKYYPESSCCNQPHDPQPELACARVLSGSSATPVAESAVPARNEAPLDSSTLKMLQEALSSGEDLATASCVAALARAVSVSSSDPARARELALEVVGLANMTARLRASLAQAASMSARCGSPPCEGEATTSSGLSSSSTASLGSGSTPATCSCPSPEGPSSSGSGNSGGSSGSCRCCCVAGDDRDTAGWDGSAPVPAVGSKRTQRPSDDMPPPAPRRPRRAAYSGDAVAAPRTPAAGSPVAAAQWNGRLLHRRDGMVAELAQLSISIPAAFADQLPGALHAAELSHRRGVPLGRHAVCRCALLPGTSARQVAALGAMAGASLVAVIPLQLCDLIVVPYLDGAGAVRVVAFLRIRA